MNTKSYIPRLCDTGLQSALQSAGAVLIEGAKWCGKTSTALNASRSAVDYVEAVINHDVSRVDDVEKKSRKGSFAVAFTGEKCRNNRYL